MATLYEAIRLWADGQNTINDCDQERQTALQTAVDALLNLLRHQRSLADLAVAYYADDHWWRRIGEEFALSGEDAAAVRDAAHWQRFMEIRHSRKAPKR